MVVSFVAVFGLVSGFVVLVLINLFSGL